MGFTKREWLALALSLLLFAGGIAYGIARIVPRQIRKNKLYETMRAISAIAAAWQDYQVDAKYGLTTNANLGQFNAAGAGWTFQTDPRTSATVTLQYTYGVDQLRPLLVPKYIQADKFRPVDGWGQQLRFATSSPLPQADADYAIRSGGANGKFDDPITCGEPRSWDDDIVYYDDEVLNWGMWGYREDWWHNPHEVMVPFVNRAAALVAKRGPSCDAISTYWYRGDHWFIFVVGPDGRMVCHPTASRVGSPTNQAIVKVAGGAIGHGWVELRSTSEMGAYVTRVTGPDGKRYIVVGFYDSLH